MAGSEPRLYSLFIFRMTGSGLLFQGICLPVTIIIRKPNKYVNPRKKLECVQTNNETEFTNRFTSTDVVRVDKKIDAFLEKHFNRYNYYCGVKQESAEGPNYFEYMYLREDEQLDDLTLLAVRRP